MERVGHEHIWVAKKDFLLRRNFKNNIQKIKSYLFKDHPLSIVQFWITNLMSNIAKRLLDSIMLSIRSRILNLSLLGCLKIQFMSIYVFAKLLDTLLFMSTIAIIPVNRVYEMMNFFMTLQLRQEQKKIIISFCQKTNSSPDSTLCSKQKKLMQNVFKQGQQTLDASSLASL